MSIYDKASLVQIPSGVKSGTLYNVVPNTADGDFDFTRGSSATRVNKDGLIETVASNVPRLDYPLLDGVVQDCPALLLEPSRQNKITHSIPNSNWAIENGASITENYSVSPDGSQNASRVQIPSGSLARIYSQFTVDANEDSISFYIKSNTGSNFNVIFYLRDAGFGTVRYTNTNLEVTNEWQRVKIENQDLSAASVQVMVLFYNTAGSGDTWDFSLWGVQAEGGSYATSYIPTSGSAVTRSADVCNGAQADFNDSEGVLFAEISALADDGTNRVICLSDASTSDRILLLYSNITNQLRFYFVSGGSDIISNHTLQDVKTNAKVALKYKSGDYSFWIDGFKLGTSTSSITFSDLNSVSFENTFGGGTSPFYGKTKQLMTFNEALSDTELENLTSWDSFREMATEQLYTIE